MTTSILAPPVEPTRVITADDREATLRLLDAGDADALAAALEHADPWDLRKRFLGVPPPTRVLIARLGRADGTHDLVLGAFADDGRLLGVAQFDRPDEEPSAEIAIEVAKDWQHCGLGRLMLERLAELARERGIHEFTASYYADNIAIRRLLRLVGHVVSSSYDAGVGYCAVDIS